MWLTLDIGNSAAKGGLFEGSSLEHTFRLSLPSEAPTREWLQAIRSVLGEHKPERAGMSSVVPPASEAARRALQLLTDQQVFEVQPTGPLPVTLAYETLETLGRDRLAAVAAGWAHYGPTNRTQSAQGVIVIDAGSAVTHELIDASGTYQGGTISAGPRLMRRGLLRGAAQLPSIDLTLPAQPVGRSTRESMQAGILYGFLDSTAGMLERLQTTLAAPARVVVTGGWGSFLAEHLEGIDVHDPHLVLRGIQVLMEMQVCSG